MATWNSDGSQGSVQALHNQSATVNGDIITIPSGTFVWTNKVFITKAITIQGNTTVSGDFAHQPITSVDNTVLFDNLNRADLNNRFFQITNNNPGGLFRITGIAFTGPTPTQSGQVFNGIVYYTGQVRSARIRIDHCHFSNMNALHYMGFYGYAYGVIDHVIIDNTVRNQGGQTIIKNGSGAGDEAWNEGFGAGGDEFIFWEDCYCNNNAGGQSSVCCGADSSQGGKYVVRYSVLNNTEFLNHGTDSGGRVRGGRGFIIHNCRQLRPYPSTMDGNRSGSLICHDNTFETNYPQGGWAPGCFRVFHYFSGAPFGGATGSNVNTGVWDSNDPILYDSGTITSVSISSGNFQTLADSSKNWTPGQWVGYQAAATNGTLIHITSSSNTALSGSEAGYGGPFFAVGQTYEIRKVLVALDQPGRGQGDLIINDPPINTAFGVPKWPRNALEPMYAWNNIFLGDGRTVKIEPFASQNAALVHGVDYFNDLGPPPGYTTFTYPHPLVGGAVVPPSPTGHRKYVGRRY